MVQLRCSEISRSGIIEDTLRENHPDLAAAVEAERICKIDRMMLQSRHANADRVGSLSTDNFKDTYETPGNRSPRLKARRLSSSGPSASPVLNKKGSAGEFMFAMDEDGDELTPLETSSSRRTPSGRMSFHSPAVDDDQWYDSRGKKLPSPGQSVSPALHKTPVGSPSPSIRPPDTSTPWGKSPLAGKLDMKDIMAQASPSQASGISLALNKQRQDRSSMPDTPSFPGKQSQKERKKMQQVQTQQTQQTKSAPILPAEATVSSPPTEPKKSTPWQTVQRPKTLIKDIPKTPSPAPSGNSAVSRSVTAPTLTMRQTVARTSSSGKQKAIETTPNPQPDLSDSQHSPAGVTKLTPSPSSSSARPQQPPHSKSTGATAPQVAPAPTIQSIRHIPNPRASDPTTGLSMSDILSQQQAEKTAIHEAATAKRSLQEIQQEQEFQEWWDLESRKVMEEERKKDVQAKRDEKSSRGRGKGKRGRGGGGGDAGGRTDSNSGTGVEEKGRGESSSQRGAQAGGRGSHRGGGKRGGKGKTIGPSV